MGFCSSGGWNLKGCEIGSEGMLGYVRPLPYAGSAAASSTRRFTSATPSPRPTLLILTPSEESATLCINSSSRRWAIHPVTSFSPPQPPAGQKKRDQILAAVPLSLQISGPISIFTPISTMIPARSTTLATRRHCTILTTAVILITWMTAGRRMTGFMHKKQKSMTSTVSMANHWQLAALLSITIPKDSSSLQLNEPTICS
ncbi:hypothetical protein TB2_044873 [Malus domestica]